MYFTLSFINFFIKKSIWKKFTTFHKQISKNKHIEIETFYCNDHLLKIELDFRLVGRDHAGIRLSGNVLGLEVEINFYDVRHWNYENNCWEG